jgi:hypothetical protein
MNLEVELDPARSLDPDRHKKIQIRQDPDHQHWIPEKTEKESSTNNVISI